MAKELGISKNDIHRVKEDIKDSVKQEKNGKKILKLAGGNPDIGIGDNGKIVLINRKTQKAIQTELDINWFKE